MRTTHITSAEICFATIKLNYDVVLKRYCVLIKLFCCLQITQVTDNGIMQLTTGKCRQSIKVFIYQGLQNKAG